MPLTISAIVERVQTDCLAAIGVAQ